MDCRRRWAVDDDRSRRLWAVDDDRRRRRWTVDDDRRRRRRAVDDDRRRETLWADRVNASLDRMIESCSKFIHSLDRTIPTYSHSAVSSLPPPTPASSIPPLPASQSTSDQIHYITDSQGNSDRRSQSDIPLAILQSSNPMPGLPPLPQHLSVTKESPPIRLVKRQTQLMKQEAECDREGDSDLKSEGNGGDDLINAFMNLCTLDTFFDIREEESLNHLKIQQMFSVLPPSSPIPSSETLNNPLYMHPNPPSPIIIARLKPLVAAFNSAKPNVLSPSGLRSALNVSSLALNSKPDLLASEELDETLNDLAHGTLAAQLPIPSPPPASKVYFMAVIDEMGTCNMKFCGKAIRSGTGNMFTAGVEMLCLNSTSKSESTPCSQAARHNFTDKIEPKFVGPGEEIVLQSFVEGKTKGEEDSSYQSNLFRSNMIIPLLQVDLVGGYYDSGPSVHVKFGLPIVYSLTMLSWSLVEFEKYIAAANQLEYVLDAIRWGTDYFIKAHRQTNPLWAQVGDENTDHYCWEMAEDVTTPRTAFKVDTENPGLDVAAETTAVLAAASIAFRPYNSSYSQLLLLHAKQLFSFADTFRKKCDDSIPVVWKFYRFSGYDDELLWAVAWLFEATDNEDYLKYMVENSGSLEGTEWAVKEFPWNNKYAGLQILMAMDLMQGGSESYTATLRQYKAKAEFFLCASLQKNNGYNAAMSPGGLLYFDEWNMNMMVDILHTLQNGLCISITSTTLIQFIDYKVEFPHLNWRKPLHMAILKSTFKIFDPGIRFG